MKKLLPILFIFLFSLTLFFKVVPTSFAQVPSPSPEPDNVWVKDDDVTFVGKMGARSSDFLNWSLKQYQWVDATKTPNLSEFWIQVRNIVYGLLILFVLITGLVMIVTRGRSITVRRFIPRFIGMIILITFSFAFIQFIYQIADVIQGFFLYKGPTPADFIGSKNLLDIGFDYVSFVGQRWSGIANHESTYISLWLIKLTAITYYVMAGILLIRKIILWFFIIISPIFPLLLLYSPIRNTAKIWLGEFFRWVLYAPIFAMLLSGLVKLWEKSTPANPGIPLAFDLSRVGQIVYPTAINIMLGGPGQVLSITNSVNLPETFALYVVSLLMLWVVIILPFILLHIFRDYVFSLQENSLVKQIMTASTTLLARGGSAFPFVPVTPPSGQQPAGLARNLPLARSYGTNRVTTQSTTNTSASERSVQSITQAQRSSSTIKNYENDPVIRLTNLTVPNMRDIAQYEIATISKTTNKTDTRVMQQSGTVQKTQETLLHIANPQTAPVEKIQEYESIHKKLIEEKANGNPLAAAILNAAQVTSTVSSSKEAHSFYQVVERLINPETSKTPKERDQFIRLRDRLSSEVGQHNLAATSIFNIVEKVRKHIEITKQQGSPLSEVLLTADLARGTNEQKEVREIKTQLEKAKSEGNNFASELLAVVAQYEQELQVSSAQLPQQNPLQSVNIDDYEAVKKMWQESYEQMDPPISMNGSTQERSQWLKNDIQTITQAVTLLSSSDTQKTQQGMQMVEKILPFLLIGGFSQAEIVAYLRAKLEAARSTLDSIEKQEKEEDTLLENREEKEKDTQVSEQQKEQELPTAPENAKDAKDKI